MRPILATALLLAACTTAPPPAARVAIEPCASPTAASLRGLAVVDQRTAWASGSDGTVVRTVDGGETWERIPCPPARDRDLRGVAAFDAATALVMAVDTPARIWRTVDGGRSWALVLDHGGDGVFLDALAFADDARGIAFGDPVDGAFLAFATADGGRGWAPLTTLPVPTDGEAGFAASGRTVAVLGESVWIATGGARSRCLRSTDGGRSWASVEWPIVGGAASRGAFAVAFRDAARGVAVGGDYREPALATGHAAWTADGGRTWRAPDGGPRGFRSAVACAAPVDLWAAAGPDGVDVSDDGGRTWRAAGDVGFHAIAFAPGTARGFAVGADGRIARVTAFRPLR